MSHAKPQRRKGRVAEIHSPRRLGLSDSRNGCPLEVAEAYESISEPELIYGFPITKMYLDTNKDHLVQYFEKARFEYIPENPPELRVQISDLGRLMYTPGQSLPTPENFPACRNYPETKKRVCYAFLTFFDEYGGVGQFGYPISN